MEVCQLSLSERHDTTRRPDTHRFEFVINNTGLILPIDHSLPLPPCSECENAFKAITLRHRSQRSSNNRGNTTTLRNRAIHVRTEFASLGLKLMKQSKARNTTKTQRQISLEHAFPLWDRRGAGEPWDLSRMSNFHITWRQGGRLEHGLATNQNAESLKLLGLCPIRNRPQPMALLKATTKPVGCSMKTPARQFDWNLKWETQYIFRNFRSAAVI
ncbi:hypothetical protein PAAG_00095 [Paracoccidioides lutzii Pb01]|uniref:Uncharacterized protein n=1 Tax=Paracoccidioides lutzii (strain ATCC MYA-826 / Pb01) TaxID=502779 RepID=C1GNK0_PARBA|nr:hypothetical protein PAAG_00095 [Paracoccidioides lutzii Pb01]EEH35772.2 hypothetical protein PAAG_00095 [Paracoccidioides lutzii Pb01]